MRDLLKTDLKRMIKDKLFLIAAIIGLGFAVTTPLLYKGLILLLDDQAGMEMFGFMFTSKSILGTSFSPMSNYGLILPVLLGIVIYKDFSYGTIRNKIISGKSRISIYLSLLISSTVLMLICILGYTLIQFSLSSLLLEYSPNISFIKDIPFILLTILFGTLCYVFITALIVFLCTKLKNVGIAIVLYFGIVFLLTILATIFNMAFTAIETMDGNKVLIGLFETLCNINVFYYLGNVIGIAESYTNSDIIFIIIDTIVYSGLITLLGILLFRKKDLK